MTLFEIRIHSRGGQGAKTIAELIVEAAIETNKYIQSFPEYGPERAGAPMCVFVRLSDQPIKTYTAIEKPDLVMVIDPTLLDVTDVTNGLDQNKILIVNTPENTEFIQKKIRFKGKIYTLDATKISMNYTGQNLPNMPMLGAFIKVTECIQFDAINRLIEEKFLKKIGAEKTTAMIDSIKIGYEAVI